jgi:UDP-N-acetylmuramoylalanine--D-glutamate ligase
MAFDYRKILVVGMARSGRAASELLAAKGRDVTVWDDDATKMDASGLAASGIAVADAGDVVGLATRSDCVVASPGVPEGNRILAAARDAGVPVVGEIEVAYHFTDARIIAVTGTNGKSTTVGVIGAILERAGVDAVVAGNVGRPFAGAIHDRDYDTVVLELSSFQLDTIDEFRAAVAVLLNVTPDHLDRYGGSFEAYAESKARILNRADAGTFYVYNADDPVAAGLASRNPGRSIGFSSERTLETGAYIDGGNLVRAWDGATVDVAPRSSFSPIGVHNAENALAAIAAVIPCGVTDDAIRDALHGYRALPHRMELVRVVNGVAYVNDSKATNVDAAVKSVRSVDGACVVILGGRDKDGDFGQLAPLAGRVRRAILIGEAAAVIRRALAGRWDLEDAADMMDAVRRASAVAAPGDTVLLAPACASFDMFESYEHRGEVFRECVRDLEEVQA